MKFRELNKDFFKDVGPVDAVINYYDSLMEDTRGLHCRIFSFLSVKGRIENKDKIYLSKNFRQDRNLSIERNFDAWHNYALNLVK